MHEVCNFSIDFQPQSLIAIRVGIVLARASVKVNDSPLSLDKRSILSRASQSMTVLNLAIFSG